jgi:hypothetical protein
LRGVVRKSFQTSTSAHPRIEIYRLARVAHTLCVGTHYLIELTNDLTIFSGGSLGSQIDEEHSKLCYLVKYARNAKYFERTAPLVLLYLRHVCLRL